MANDAFSKDGLGPPVAARRPHEVVAPAGTRLDPYYWLRDDTRSDPEVIGYLTAENAYADRILAEGRALEETLYQEIVGRLKQDDSSVPYERRGYWYYSRFEPGRDYPITARRRGEMTAPEEVMLDQPAMAAISACRCTATASLPRGPVEFRIGARILCISLCMKLERETY